MRIFFVVLVVVKVNQVASICILKARTSFTLIHSPASLRLQFHQHLPSSGNFQKDIQSTCQTAKHKQLEPDATGGEKIIVL